jgi:hypothetical protein
MPRKKVKLDQQLEQTRSLHREVEWARKEATAWGKLAPPSLGAGAGLGVALLVGSGLAVVPMLGIMILGLSLGAVVGQTGLRYLTTRVNLALASRTVRDFNVAANQVQRLSLPGSLSADVLRPFVGQVNELLPPSQASALMPESDKAASAKLLEPITASSDRQDTDEKLRET